MKQEFLGQEFKAHFAFGTPSAQAAALAAAKAEQEAMAGHALTIVETRQTHYVDATGKDVYEVWATFVPSNEPHVPNATDFTQVAPQVKQ